VTPERLLKVQNILIFVGIGLGFGLLYNYLFYPHSLTEFLEAASISIILGLMVGILEEFLLKNIFYQRPFLVASIVRLVLYSVIISIVLCLVSVFGVKPFR
jgi:hypothetical protein